MRVRALNALSGSTFFASLAERLMVSNLRQVRRYLTEPELREKVLARVLDEIGPTPPSLSATLSVRR